MRRCDGKGVGHTIAQPCHSDRRTAASASGSARTGGHGITGDAGAAIAGRRTETHCCLRITRRGAANSRRTWCNRIDCESLTDLGCRQISAIARLIGIDGTGTGRDEG